MQENNVMDVVRICPLCGKHNSPDETFCACGAMLADVDFTHLGAKPKEAAAEAVAPPAAEMVKCLYADCGQLNPPGSERCVYCNRVIVALVTEEIDEKQSYLPPALREKFQVLDFLPTEGGQADLLLAETAQREQRVIKLYRKGIKPDWDVLKSLASLPTANLVKFFDYGETGGISYEVMEYCAAGSLRTLLDSGPQSNEMLQRLVAQMSSLLKTLHEKNILHRDIKPENILLRAASPLQIALTDFGAASLKMATQYFTGGARTAYYSAPEVLTGVLDEKADWWSLGMVVLEAVTGKHPYSGLSEQVALHQLATRVVEVKDVFDDRFRMLCRGLLMRNPKQRWGADEVARWLMEDVTQKMPEEGSDGAVVRAYTLVNSQCVSRTDLALALVKNWEEGKKDLMRGTIANWVENELRDFNLARDIHDVLARRDLSDDARLMRVIISALPGVPPVWKGKIVTQESLVRAATQAIQSNQDKREDKDALAWLLSIYKEDVLKVLGERGNADMARIAEELHHAVGEYRKLWERAKELEAEWRKRPRAHAQEVADVDYLMFLAPIRMNVPSLNKILPDVVLALYVPAFVQTANNSVVQANVRMAENCGWYAKLVEETQSKGNVFWSASQQLIPFAMEDAKYEYKVQNEAVKNDEKTVSGVVEKIEKQCRRLVELERLAGMDESGVAQIRSEVEGWLEMNAWAKRLEHKNASLRELTGKLEKLTNQAIRLLPTLDAHEHNLDIKGIWLQPMRLFIMLMIIIGIGRYIPVLGVLLSMAAGAGIYMLKRKASESGDELADKLDWLVFGAKEFLHAMKNGG